MSLPSIPTGLERGLLVIELLVTLPGGVSFGEIARRLDMSNTSTMRLLSGMVEAGYLLKGDDRLYRLGVRARLLGQPADLHERLLRLGRGFLDRLTRTTHQTAIIVHHTGEYMMCVDRILVEKASPLQEPGHLVGDLHAAPWGWWFRSIEAWQASLEEVPAPGSRQASNADIVAALLEAGADGTTFHESSDRRRLAAPVRLGERIIACLGLGGTAESLPDTLLAHCQSQLSDAARSFSRLLSRN